MIHAYARMNDMYAYTGWVKVPSFAREPSQTHHSLELLSLRRNRSWQTIAQMQRSSSWPILKELNKAVWLGGLMVNIQARQFIKRTIAELMDWSLKAYWLSDGTPDLNACDLWLWSFSRRKVYTARVLFQSIRELLSWQPFLLRFSEFSGEQRNSLIGDLFEL